MSLRNGPSRRKPWLAVACLAALPAPALAGDCGSLDQLEAEGYRIGKIRVRNLAIFEDETGQGVPALYQLADSLHVDTRDSVIRSQLLFAEGDAFSVRLAEETLRNLRDLRYLREPQVRAIDCHDGIVDLEVAVREAVFSQVFEKLEASQDGEIHLHIVAHSLGVTIAHDFLYALFGRQVDPAFPVIPVRALMNEGTRKFMQRQVEVIAKVRAGELDQKAAQLEIEHFWAGALRRAVIEGDVESGSLMAGQSVGMVTREQTTAEVIEEIVDQAARWLAIHHAGAEPAVLAS